MKNARTATAREAGLLTSAVRVENVLFGPIGLFGENWQPRRNYRIAGEDTIAGERLVILEARIRTEMAGSHCDGKAWIRESDGSVPKIEWDQPTLICYKNYHFFTAESKVEF